MLILKKVAVTGGLASGKSSVCRLFSNLGAYVASADDIVHHLLSPETTIGKQVIALIGKDIVNNEKINRAIIAERVFKQPTLLRSLEKILHPAVGVKINEQYEQVKAEGKAKLFVAEIPLLFESSDLNTLPFDATIAVLTDESISKKRYQEMGHSAQEYELRMKQQMSPAEKARHADYVIHNNGSEKELEKEATNIFNMITNL